MSHRYAIGIDFGTTQSYLAFMPRDGQDLVRLAKCNPNPQAARTTHNPGPWAAMPSRLLLKNYKNSSPPEFEVLAADITDETDETRDQYNIISRLKRVLGRMRDAQDLPEYRVWKSLDKIGEDEYVLAPPEALAGYLLWHMKNLAIEREEIFRDAEIDHITITVPAMSSISQKRATQFAARLAGFKQEIFTLEEPLAAFLYHMHRLNTPGRGGVFENLDREYVMVFDFGGGTCDLSLIRCTRGQLPIVVGRQMGEFGGEDIDELIARSMLKPRGKNRGRTDYDELSPAGKDTAHRKARQLKEKLLEEDEAQVTMGYIGAKTGTWKLNMATLEKLLNEVPVSTRFNMIRAADGPIMTHIASLVDALIREAAVSEYQIKYIILAGGSSKLRLVRRWFQDTRFRWLPSNAIIDTDAEACIALGAAMHQYYLHNQQSKLRKLVQPTLPWDIRLLHSRDPVGQGWRGNQILADRNSQIGKHRTVVWVKGVKKSGSSVSISLIHGDDYDHPLVTREIEIAHDLPVSLLRITFRLTEDGLIEDFRCTPAHVTVPPLVMSVLSRGSRVMVDRAIHGGEQAIELLKDYDLDTSMRIELLRNQFGIEIPS